MNDNQFGETNFFANRGALLDNYDLDREYGLSLLDTPHRVNITGTFELPFGEGKRWQSEERRGERDRRRLGGDRHRHLSERLPGADLPVEQQLGPARQRSASERGRPASIRARSGSDIDRIWRLVQHGGVERWRRRSRSATRRAPTDACARR